MRLVGSRILLEKRRRALTRFVVGAKQVEVLHDCRLDVHSAGRRREVCEPFDLHVDGAPKSRDTDESIDDRVVVIFRQRLRLSQLGREAPGIDVRGVEGRGLPEREL